MIRDDGDLVADLKGQRFVALDEAVLLIELGDADLGDGRRPSRSRGGGRRGRVVSVFAAGVDDGMMVVHLADNGADGAQRALLLDSKAVASVATSLKI